MSTSTAGRFVGQSVRRREDPRLLTGHGRYVDDVMLPGMLHATFVRSDVARGRIVEVDVTEARALDGVRAVLTAADLNPHAGSLQPTLLLEVPGAPLRPLADGDVRFVGEPIVLVIAVSRYVAEDAADLVRIEIESETAVVDAERALDAETPIVHPELGTNLGAEMAFPIAPELQALMDGAAPHVVRRTFRQHRHTPVPMETRGIVVQYEPAGGAIEAWMSTQNPHEAKQAIARVTGVPAHLVRVQAHDVGGGFGQKFFTPREELVVALAARRLGITVKWIEDRRENLIASNHARADVGECVFALDDDGRLLGTYIDHIEDSGAFPVGATGGAGPLVGMLFSGPYKSALGSMRSRSVWTNTCGRGAYRGPWMFETVAREQMVDEAARAIGIDPLEWRRRNVVPTAELPYTLSTGLPLELVSPSETLEQAVAIIDYDGFRAEQQRVFAAEGRLLGVGIGLYVEPSTGMMDPMGTEIAVVRVNPNGQVTVALGTGSHGQGIETTMAQVVAEELGIDYDDVTIVQGDSAVTAYGRGTGGSGTAVIAGNACRDACAGVRTKAIEIAAHLMEAAPEDLEIVDGQVTVKGTPARAVAWKEVARIAYLETARLPAGMEVGLEATATFKAPPFSWSNACHVCTVEVDRATGQVEILRYVVSEDCGVMINPMIVEGQVAGGVVQGIGGTLYEHFVYDADGNPLTTTFMDYLLPTTTEVPTIEYGHVETPSPTPGGHKGMGEGGAIGSPPAVFNTVADALALAGAMIDRTPLTPDALLTRAAIVNEYLVERLRPFGTTIFAEMSALAVATGAINLGQGFPDTDGPDALKQVAIDAINEGRNQYPPGIGIPELRAAIRAHQLRFYGLDFDADTEILVTAGATEAVAATLLALCGPGDEVVTFEPYYDSYAACIALAGAERRVVTLRPPDYAFAIDELRAAVTSRTKLLLLNSPHNPTGKVFNADELAAIAAIAIERDLVVVTDEVYEHLVFEGTHTPIATLPGMRERTVTISSGGKTFSFTGWKIGWVCAAPELTTAVKATKQFLTYVNGGPFQYAIAAGLELPDDFFTGIAADLRDKRDRLCAGLNDAGFGVYRPQGTYFVTADIRPLGATDGLEFCRVLPARCGVVAVPTVVFYDDVDAGRSLVRFACCKRVEVLDDACARLKALKS